MIKSTLSALAIVIALSSSAWAQAPTCKEFVANVSSKDLTRNLDAEYTFFIYYHWVSHDHGIVDQDPKWMEDKHLIVANFNNRNFQKSWQETKWDCAGEVVAGKDTPLRDIVEKNFRHLNY